MVGNRIVSFYILRHSNFMLGILPRLSSSPDTISISLLQHYQLVIFRSASG